MMLFGTVGGYSSGGMLGMGLEAYATDVIGIRLTGQIGGYGDEYDHHDGGRLFDGDSSWVPTSGNGNVESAVARLCGSVPAAPPAAAAPTSRPSASNTAESKSGMMLDRG